jgi:serine/threonine protein kinase
VLNNASSENSPPREPFDPSSSQAPSCPTCGTAIPSDAPGSWCPVCLLDELMGNGPEMNPLDGRPGDRVGPYLLLEQIGEGGFGIVYRAEQSEPIHREVALKLIKPGMDSREIIRRFEAERQSLARMEHPNIAAVLDAGTSPDGRPYFVMELVRGQPLTEYCDDRKLSLRQRIELFLPVCLAVHHAHQKATLHRDLKPSNILVTEVDGRPVPKVIDFGIAKALGSGESLSEGLTLQQTMPGAIIGTLQYMSPEQAGAEPDLDTRSDIYALGVILYELLVGHTPLTAETIRKAAFDEVLRLVREADPPRPSVAAESRDQSAAGCRATSVERLRGSVRGDLDWITLRALEKERERRYDSAQALADDLQRYLRDEPVDAGPPSQTYRLGKFIRRNKVVVSAGAAITLSLVAGIAVSLWQANEAKAAKAKTTDILHRFLTAEISESTRLGDYAKALPLIDEAIRSGHPDQDHLRFIRIEACEALNDPETPTMIKALDSATVAPAQRPLVDFWKADILLQQGDSVAGMELMNRALGQGLPPVEKEIAAATLSATVTEAVAHYQKAAQLAPRRSMVQRNLALALLLSGRVEEARTQIAACHLMFPEDGNYYILETLMEAFQRDGIRALAAAEKIPDDSSGARSYFVQIAKPLAAFFDDIVGAMCGQSPRMSLWDQLAMTLAIAKLAQSDVGIRDLPNMSKTPPLLTRGIRGLATALLAYRKGAAEATAVLRQTLEICDESTLWALLATLEFASGHYEEALLASRKGQTTPALVKDAHAVARMLEGAAEAGIWQTSKDPAALQRAGEAFADTYNTGLPKAALSSMSKVVALRLDDKRVARMIAWCMPEKSLERLSFEAQIEYAEGNTTKARALAEQACSVDPTATAAKALLDKINSGTLDVPMK